MKFDFTLHKNTPIYSRKKPLNCYHGGYTYRLISCLLCRLPHGQQVDLNDIILRKKEEKWRFVVSSQNKLLSQGCIHYVKFDIRTNKPLNSSFPLQHPVYCFDTKLTIDLSSYLFLSSPIVLSHALGRPPTRWSALQISVDCRFRMSPWFCLGSRFLELRVHQDQGQYSYPKTHV